MGIGAGISGHFQPDSNKQSMNVTVDYLVRDGECMAKLDSSVPDDLDELIQFRLEANVNTYAAFMNEVDPLALTPTTSAMKTAPTLTMTLMLAENSLLVKKLSGKMERHFTA